MFSPALRHRQKKLAEASGAATAAKPGTAPAEPKADSPQGQEYAALRVLLHDNLRALSDIQSLEARNPKKAEFAKAFAPWIEGVLAAGEQGQAAQDEIVVTNMIWAVDYRDFDYALRIGAHVIRFGLILPERYSRTAPCFLAEDIATIALQQHEEVTLEQLLAVRQLIEGHDMPDPVMAKLHKAIGRAYGRKADAFDPAAENAPAGGKSAYLSEAFDHFKRALQLDANVGVKKDIEQRERQLKAATEELPT